MRKPIVLALLAEFRTLFKNLYRQGALGTNYEITFLVHFIKISWKSKGIEWSSDAYSLFVFEINSPIIAPKEEGQKCQVSANRKIYNSIQINWSSGIDGRTTLRYQYPVTESKSGSD